MDVEIIKANNMFDNSNAVVRKNRLRVAAYCRVSTNDEDQIKSYESMVKYYTDLITKNPNWEYVGVYADRATTGTKAETRENFQQLIADCMLGKIDMVIAKSLSRFARNTLDTLKYVRQLREKNVAIYFEVEKINTIKDGEFLLTILSSVAQQEVENTSAYVKKGLKMKMKRGEMVGFQGCLGYDYDCETKSLSINEKGAEAVRYIFERYVAGAGSCMIARELNEKGIMTIRGNPWTTSSVMGIVRNEKYSGDLLLGKTFTVDPISKRRLENIGEEDRFYVKDHHPPIISREVYQKAQEIRFKRNGGRTRGVEIGKREKYSRQFAFSSLLECGFCGGNLSRRCWHSGSRYRKIIWQCVKSTKAGKLNCPDSKGIPEQIIEEAFLESYRQITSNDKDVMEEFLRRIEATLGDSTIREECNKADKEARMLSEKRKKLLEKYVDGGVNKEMYESLDEELQQKLSDVGSKVEYYRKLLGDRKNIQRRLEEFKKTLEKNQVLDEFDRAVFESMIEKVIIGGIDDDGKKDPYKITFIYKNGFKDSMGNAKKAFGPRGRGKGVNVSSNAISQVENLSVNDIVDARRDGGAFNAHRRLKTNLRRILRRAGIQRNRIRKIKGEPPTGWKGTSGCRRRPTA